MAFVDNSTLLVLGPNAWVLLAVLLVLAAVVWRTALGRHPAQMLVAGVRALVQLAAVALVIAWLADKGALAFAFVALMFIVGVWTSGRRVAPAGRWWVAAVALGFMWPAARLMVGKDVAGEAVLPSVDQARTAGLVTLPGAFVGMILGGAAPLDAGLIQLLVLVSLLLVNSVAASATLWLSCRDAWARPPG
jgi:putative ABC transport system permease protein